MNPANFKELAEQVAIPVGHLRYLLEQIELHIPKATVWAFGSRVKWSHRPESDLDLAVCCDKETAQKALPKLNYALDESVLPFKVQIADFHRLPENMQENIKKNYLVLYQSQEKPLPTDWKETTLGELGKIVTGKTPPTACLDYYGGNIPFVTPSDMDYRKTIETTERYLTGEGVDAVKGSYIPSGTIMVSCIGSDMGKVAIAKKDCVTNQQINSIIVDDTHYCPDFIYYNLRKRQEEFQNLSGGGSALPILNKGHFALFTITVPPLPEQKAIAAILSTFDNKIELLRSQNKTLEQIAQTVFKEWFIQFKIKNQKLKIKNETGLPEGWMYKGLDEIADFLNGLALQNYPPENEADVLPVIKIRELKAGITEQTDKASKRIKPEYIVDDGDVLFSWSGSLDVVLWCYGKGALNQHLFKVTSKKYPKWFYYYWILEHLQFFRSIAEAKATTMGHIQRHHLAEALVAVPDDNFVAFADSKIKPVFEHIISNNSQIQTLSKLRDLFLPKLMKGEIRVKNISENF